MQKTLQKQNQNTINCLKNKKMKHLWLILLILFSSSVVAEEKILNSIILAKKGDLNAKLILFNM